MSKTKLISGFFFSALLWEGLKLFWKKIKQFKKGKNKKLNASFEFNDPDPINPEIINEKRKEDFTYTMTGKDLSWKEKCLTLAGLILLILTPVGGGILGFFLIFFLIDLFTAIIRFLFKSFNS